MRHADKRLPVHLAIAACTFFFLAGQAFLPLLGIQNDEALFGSAFLQPFAGYSVPLGHSHLPLMLMSYLGTLKAWIYRAVFAVFQPGVWSLREPALLFGVAGVWLFFLLLRRIAGARAAVIGCGLLAVDAKLLQAAAGYRRRILAVIPDSFGRPTYEVYQFVDSDVTRN